MRDHFTWRPIVPNRATIERAWHVENCFHLSYWDSLIVAAEREAGYERLLSEYLQDGQDLDGVRVVNPFRHAPD